MGICHKRLREQSPSQHQSRRERLEEVDEFSVALRGFENKIKTDEYGICISDTRTISHIRPYILQVIKIMNINARN